MTTLLDLDLAYCNAKVDLYYTAHISREAIADREKNLHTNLRGLLFKLRGDHVSSAILATLKERWQRDLLRAKRGIIDYCLIGGIEIQALCQCQSSNHSPVKPVSNRFEIDLGRKVLPAGEHE